MSIQLGSALLTLDFASGGLPFVWAVGKSSVDATGLDTVSNGEPFWVAASVGSLEVDEALALTGFNSIPGVSSESNIALALSVVAGTVKRPFVFCFT